MTGLGFFSFCKQLYASLLMAQHAMENPDGAALLANAKRAIDGLVNNKIIKAPTGKDWKGQLDDQYTSTGDITDLIKSFGFSLERLGGAGGGMAGGAPGSAGAATGHL